MVHVWSTFRQNLINGKPTPWCSMYLHSWCQGVSPPPFGPPSQARSTNEKIWQVSMFVKSMTDSHPISIAMSFGLLVLAWQNAGRWSSLVFLVNLGLLLAIYSYMKGYSSCWQALFARSQIVALLPKNVYLHKNTLESMTLRKGHWEWCYKFMQSFSLLKFPWLTLSI